jgi:DNA-binding CsgD family transcriptional regulator
VNKLSPRETDVLKLVASGLAMPAVAEKLSISPLTANAYMKHVRLKLNAHTQAQAVAIGIFEGIIGDDR